MYFSVLLRLVLLPAASIHSTHALKTLTNFCYVPHLSSSKSVGPSTCGSRDLGTSRVHGKWRAPVPCLQLMGRGNAIKVAFSFTLVSNHIYISWAQISGTTPQACTMPNSHCDCWTPTLCVLQKLHYIVAKTHACSPITELSACRQHGCPTSNAAAQRSLWAICTRWKRSPTATGQCCVRQCCQPRAPHHICLQEWSRYSGAPGRPSQQPPV